VRSWAIKKAQQNWALSINKRSKESNEKRYD
jgi:hypothetical protein